MPEVKVQNNVGKEIFVEIYYLKSFTESEEQEWAAKLGYKGY